jgi:SOS-response transcriptional repressor LexA
MDLSAHAKALTRFHAMHRRMPSYREMLTLFGYKSTNAVAKVITQLVAIGLVYKDTTGALILAQIAGEVPLVGYVEAGMPSPAEAADLDRISVAGLAGADEGAEVYALKVKGDSMINAGIHNGDTVLARRQNHARVGQIVIADIDGQWTMKYLRQKKNGMQYLEAANPDYPDLLPEESLSIGGVVVGVVKRFA